MPPGLKVPGGEGFNSPRGRIRIEAARFAKPRGNRSGDLFYGGHRSGDLCHEVPLLHLNGHNRWAAVCTHGQDDGVGA